MAKVVLIDDEKRLLSTLARFLEREGLDVVRAASFAAADEHLQPGRFEVLVTDIVMPGIDGMGILEEVVNRRQCQEPVILITGEPNLETASQAVRSGAFDYVEKPVTKDRLLEVVNRGLRHVKLLRERDAARHREIQLLRSLAEIGESASVLSHEIKTPINALRHALRAVGEKLGVEDGVVIDEFVSSMGRIDRLLSKTLSFAKPLELRMQEVGIRDVVDDAAAQCAKVSEFANMVVDNQCDEALRCVLDPDAFSDVLVNLFRNAAEACGGDGAITVASRRLREHVQIDVRDTGPGVPVKMRAEIFKPFRSFKDYGTGIGLAFSRKVIQAHDGSIELVASESGACFRIELPDRMTETRARPEDS